jgi:hypothetical protein
MGTCSDWKNHIMGTSASFLIGSTQIGAVGNDEVGAAVPRPRVWRGD